MNQNFALYSSEKCICNLLKIPVSCWTLSCVTQLYSLRSRFWVVQQLLTFMTEIFANKNHVFLVRFSVDKILPNWSVLNLWRQVELYTWLDFINVPNVPFLFSIDIRTMSTFGNNLHTTYILLVSPIFWIPTCMFMSDIIKLYWNSTWTTILFLITQHCTILASSLTVFLFKKNLRYGAYSGLNLVLFHFFMIHLMNTCINHSIIIMLWTNDIHIWNFLKRSYCFRTFYTWLWWTD